MEYLLSEGMAEGSGERGERRCVTAAFERSVSQAGAMRRTVYGVPASMRVMDALSCMQSAALSAVAVVEPSDREDPVSAPSLIIVRGVNHRGREARTCPSFSLFTGDGELGSIHFLEAIQPLPSDAFHGRG